MLTQFMLKNVLSFKEETVFDMRAINAYKEHPENTADSGYGDKILRVATIYGANASGKSNFTLAMYIFRAIVAESLNNANDGKLTAIRKFYLPFLLSEEKTNSEFEIVDIIDDAEYRYGFEYNDGCIVEEWLYKKNLKTSRTAVIFERTTNAVEFGASVRKECDRYKDQVPGETLVLSFFNKLKLKTAVFNDLYARIMSMVVFPAKFDADFDKDTNIITEFLPSIIDDNKSKLLAFLAAIDIDIIDISYREHNGETFFFTVHRGRDNKEYEMGLFTESSGTLKCIVLFIHAWFFVSFDGILVIDELNTKLHPLLLKFIVDLFYDSASKAQLIYTTHDTTLMDKKFFRRDQIWFVEKDEFGESRLFALSDYKVRSDASFEKDYLAGVYGGIPMLREFSMKEDK